MTPFISVDHSDQWKRNKADKPGWLSCATMLSLCCLFVQCTSDTTSSNSSDGTGGASAGSSNASGAAGGASATGATSSSGTSSVETKTTGGASSSLNGGASAVNIGGAPGSTSSGGTTPTGGAASKTSGAGGAAPTAGASATGGKSTGGANGTAGKSSSGGATSTGGKASTGGAANPGGATGTAGKSSSGVAGSTSTSTFTLTSPGWTNMTGCGPTAKTSCAPLPAEITRSGGGTSPELHWTGAPAGTKSFVVMLQDLNNGTAHWILWNIAPTVTSLAANVDQSTATPATPAGSQQCGKGTDAATSDGYYGPGAPCNVYEFVVYALSIAPFSPTTATDQESVRTQLQALGESILGTATLRGRTNTGC